jgi:hypothetical protein
MARLSAWTTGLVLAFFGSQIAHVLTYVTVVPDPARRARVLAASGHSYFAYLPFAIGLLCAVALLGLAARVVATERRGPAPGWPLALLPALTFVVQEHVERLGQTGAFPWHAVLEPTFATGLALQLPLGILAFVVARALLRGAEGLGALLRGRPQRVAVCHTAPQWTVFPEPARSQALPTGRITRGPPALAAT